MNRESEPKDREQLDWEVRRVAAAFGVRDWETQDWGHLWMIKGAARTGDCVNYGVNALTGRWMGVRVGNNTGQECEVYEKVAALWMCRPHPQFNPQMARGLYCLGFEDQSVWAELNHPLTAHEQLELRLSMPSHFWPAQWE